MDLTSSSENLFATLERDMQCASRARFISGDLLNRSETMIRLHFSFLLLLLVSPLRAESILEVATYNIRQDAASDKGNKDWQQRKGKLAGYLLNKRFSIIGLQEVKHNQLRDLETALPDHASTGVGRDDGKTGGEYSPIFYHRKMWKLDPVQHGTFWLSDTPEVPKSRTWGNRYPRICTWARLVGLTGPLKGKAIYVYNTHWDHQSQPSRVKSAELILKRIKMRSNQQEPVILMGDFNATTENPAIRAVLTSGMFVDHGAKQVRTGSRWTVDFAPGLRIDHVFTSPSIKEAEVKVESNPGVGGLAASDHHPVALRVASFLGIAQPSAIE